MQRKKPSVNWVQVLAPLVLAGVCVVSARSGGRSEAAAGAFAVGCQSNTFIRFTVFEAIEKTVRAGGTLIEFQPDQKLSPEDPNTLWNHTVSATVVAKVKARLKEKGLRAAGYGVVGIPPDEAGARKVFDFAREVGIRTLITESVGSIDILEKLAREYDIAVAFHHHPRRANDPGYRLWDPDYVAQLVAGRDRRIGACADTGNWMRSGVRPIDGLRILKGRIICVHLKDMTELDRRDAHEVPFGTGASGIKECLEELRAQGFNGHIAVEYEYNAEDNLAEVARCIAFVRAYRSGDTNARQVPP